MLIIHRKDKEASSVLFDKKAEIMIKLHVDKDDDALCLCIICLVLWLLLS
jgi:hypothetical protein